QGPSAATSVVVVDTLPAGVVFVSASNGGTEACCVVTWPAYSTLANCAHLSYTVTVTAPASGVLLNVARANAATADPDTVNNNGSAASTRVTTRVGEVTDLSVSKSGPATAPAAQLFPYTTLFRSQGPSTATSVVVVDTLPAGVVFVSASNGGTEAGGVVT